MYSRFGACGLSVRQMNFEEAESGEHTCEANWADTQPETSWP